MSERETYPFDMTLLGHKERLTWLISTYDRVSNVATYAQQEAAKHSFAAQDAAYLQGVIVELINHHKAAIAALEAESEQS